jgi:hypothetical protein
VGLVLVDIYDNMTLIIEKEGEGYIHGIPLKPRPVPPVIPEKIKEGSREATVFIQDIYEGEGLQGVPRGTVKSLGFSPMNTLITDRHQTMWRKAFRVDGT